MIPATYLFKTYDQQWWLDQLEPKQTHDIVEKPHHRGLLTALIARLRGALHRPAHASTQALDACSAA